MIPQISQAPGLAQPVIDFIKLLKFSGFTGDTATDYADRLTMATDNSIYQLLPDAVLFPRSTQDVALIARLAATPEFAGLAFTPRGGGTGTNGQSLNTGIVVDMSRHMNHILEVNAEQRWVRSAGRDALQVRERLCQGIKDDIVLLIDIVIGERTVEPPVIEGELEATLAAVASDRAKVTVE